MSEYEEIKGNWKISTRFLDDEELYDEWEDEKGNKGKGNQCYHVDRVMCSLVHIPTNKTVKTFYSYEELNAVGEYKSGPDAVYFSEDGLYVLCTHGTEDELASFLTSE